MSSSADDAKVWDESIASDIVGKVLLVGLTYLKHDGTCIEQLQLHGTVESADSHDGIVLSLSGQRAGERYTLPPDTRAIEPAAPGEYRLRASGEFVVDPNYLATFTVTKPQ